MASRETDLGRCGSCQRTAGSPRSAELQPSSAARTCNWIGLRALIPGKRTQRVCLSFLLDTILDTRGNSAPGKIESETYLLKGNLTAIRITCMQHKGIRAFLEHCIPAYNKFRWLSFFLLYLMFDSSIPTSPLGATTRTDIEDIASSRPSRGISVSQRSARQLSAERYLVMIW